MADAVPEHARPLSARGCARTARRVGCGWVLRGVDLVIGGERGAGVQREAVGGLEPFVEQGVAPDQKQAALAARTSGGEGNVFIRDEVL